MSVYRATTQIRNDAVTVEAESPDPRFRISIETNGQSNGAITVRDVQQAELLVTMLQQAIDATS